MSLRNEARILMAARAGQQSGFELSRRARMGPGTLYPILARLERDSLLESLWGEIPAGYSYSYRPRIYRITDSGRIILHHMLVDTNQRVTQLERTSWGRFRIWLEATIWPVPISEEARNA